MIFRTKPLKPSIRKATANVRLRKQSTETEEDDGDKVEEKEKVEEKYFNAQQYPNIGRKPQILKISLKRMML